MIRNIFIIFVLAGALTACTGPRYVDSGFGVTTYGFIGIDAADRGFTYDQRTNLREYAEGSYVFVSRDSIALDARFDSLAIPYQLIHNAATLNHVNAYLPYRSVIRCSEPQRCRVVVYRQEDLYPPARHDSLTTELFDVVGDETVLTYIEYGDWYRIAIRDTVRVIATVRELEHR